MENTMKMYVTADEAAQILGVSRGYAYKIIRAGVFSSTVSAELLMLCVDYDINAVIGEDIEYIIMY